MKWQNKIAKGFYEARGTADAEDRPESTSKKKD
jgi:hypothetical protein